MCILASILSNRRFKVSRGGQTSSARAPTTASLKDPVGNNRGSGSQTLNNLHSTSVLCCRVLLTSVDRELSCHEDRCHFELRYENNYWHLKPTPLQWLPALSHIAPLGVCRHEITREELHRTFTYPDLPIHEDLGNQPNWTSANFLEEFDVNGEWRKTWVESDSPNQDFVHVRANRPRPPKKAMGESEQDDSTPCKVSQSSPSMENERQPCM